MRTFSWIVATLLLTFGASTARPDEALDKAFQTLRTYAAGQDRGGLLPIDRAAVAAHADANAAQQLETRLAEVLQARPPQAAGEYICRQLSLVGSAACVPALAPLLEDERLSHMARYALERIPDPAAAAALRAALPRATGLTKVGMINSLGARRDGDSTAVLTAALQDPDEQIAGAAAAALGAIGSVEAAEALGEFHKTASEPLRPAAADARLACAEYLLAAGSKVQALAIYKSLAAADQPRHVRLAATRGLLAAAQQK